MGARVKLPAVRWERPAECWPAIPTDWRGAIDGAWSRRPVGDVLDHTVCSVVVSATSDQFESAACGCSTHERDLDIVHVVESHRGAYNRRRGRIAHAAQGAL